MLIWWSEVMAESPRMLFLVIQMTVNSKKNIEQKEYLIF